MAKDVIIALDFENKEKTLAFLDQFTGRKPFVKIGMDMNLTVIALAYIEIELQHHPVRNLSEEKREIAAKLKKCNVTTLITVGKLIDVLIDQQEMIKKAELD